MSDLPISFQTLTANAGLVVLVAHALEFLKGSPYFPWLTRWTDELTKVFAFFASVGTAVGMQLSFTTAGDSGTLALAGIPVTAAALAQMIVHVAANYGGVKAYYHAAVKPNAAAR